MSSADMSPRNMDRRVEVGFPLESSDVKDYVVNHILATYLADNTKAWILHPDGSYSRRVRGAHEREVRAQQKFIEIARDYGIKSIPYDMAIRHNPVKEKGSRPVAKAKRKNTSSHD